MSIRVHSWLKNKRVALALILLFAIGLGSRWGWNYWREHRYDKEIIAAARRYQMDPSLVKAVVWRESRFDSQVRGRAGELGLMQIRSTAALEWAKAEHLVTFQHASCLNPATNTMAGAWYLKKALKRYDQTDNPVPYALADYNAGRSNLLKWKHGAAETNSAAFVAQIEFPSTRQYVLAIMKRAEQYKGTLDTREPASSR